MSDHAHRAVEAVVSIVVTLGILATIIYLGGK